MTVGNLAIDILVFPVHVEHFVVRVARVDTHVVFEVLANLVAPGYRELVTPVVHLAKVGRSRLCAHGRGDVLLDIEQHLAVPLTISIEGHCQASVKEVSIDTHIELVRFVPVHIGVHSRVVFVDGDTVAGIIASAFAEYHTLVGILSIHLHPLPCGKVVTASETE